MIKFTRWVCGCLLFGVRGWKESVEVVIVTQLVLLLLQEEEFHRSNRWKQFLDMYSDAKPSEGEGGGGVESAVEEKELFWGSLSAVQQALQHKHSGVKIGDGVGACPWAEELKKLVWEGVPVSLRGEVRFCEKLFHYVSQSPYISSMMRGV